MFHSQDLSNNGTLSEYELKIAIQSAGNVISVFESK